MSENLKTETELFVDIILSEEGISKEFEDIVDGDTIGYFKGKKGTIAINLSAPFIYNKICVAHMRQLGIDELIIRLFPQE